MINYVSLSSCYDFLAIAKKRRDGNFAKYKIPSKIGITFHITGVFRQAKYFKSRKNVLIICLEGRMDSYLDWE